MKKYVKPELYYERFELTQTIADCAWEVQLNGSYDCVAKGDAKYGLSGKILFTEDRHCNTYEYCYMASTDGLRTFQS